MPLSEWWVNPGRTTRYIPSREVDIILNQRDPDRIKIRDKKLEIIGADMKKNDGVRIQYSAKYQAISNAWKNGRAKLKDWNAWMRSIKNRLLRRSLKPGYRQTEHGKLITNRFSIISTGFIRNMPVISGLPIIIRKLF